MIKEVKTGTYIKSGENFNFNFYTDLTIVDKITFVNSVVNSLVDDSNCDFIIKDLIFDFYLINVFTDIDTSDLASSNTFFDDVEEFLEETNIVDIIKVNVKDGLINELNKAVNVSIEYKTGIKMNPLNDALTSLINTLERKINEVDLNGMAEMVAKFNGMTEDFTPENIVKAYIASNTSK